MNEDVQDILEKVIGYGILALLVIGVGWKLWMTLFSILYLIFNMTKTKGFTAMSEKEESVTITRHFTVDMEKYAAARKAGASKSDSMKETRPKDPMEAHFNAPTPENIEAFNRVKAAEFPAKGTMNMAGKRDPNRYGIMCYVPTELAAKIKSYVSGRSVPNKGREGQKVHTPFRPMAMSDLLIALAEEKLKDQEVLPQYANWGDMIRNHNRKARNAERKTGND